MEALRDMLEKNESNEGLDKEISIMLSEKNLSGLKNSMGLVWDRQAKMQEIMSTIEDSATAKQNKYIVEMNKVSKELKKSIHDCMLQIETQKKKLIVIHELFKKRLKSKEEGSNLEDKNLRDAVEMLLEERSGGIRLNDSKKEKEEDSEYHSFEEDPEELKNVQNTFFNKILDDGNQMEKQQIGEDEENENDLTIIKMIAEESTIQDESQSRTQEVKKREKSLLLKSDSKKSGKQPKPKLDALYSIGRKSIECLADTIQFESIRNLITKNPAFVKFEVQSGPERREKMPVYRDPSKTINAWSILKHNLGKDFSRITMPVYVNEPYSMLHRVTEYVHYQECFRTANRTDDQYLRAGYILAGFFILYAHTINRIKKPFNPLLGETFEYIDNDLRVLVELISHHPPVCSFHAECSDFILEGFFSLIIKFGYKGFQINPTGDLKIFLKRTKEKFTILRPVANIHNYILGTMYIWHSGDLIVKNEDTGDTAIMYLKPKGWTSRVDYEAEGKIVDKSGKTHYSLYGRWDSFASAIDIETQKEITLVTKKPDVPNYEQQYYFSKFAIGLNHLTKPMLLKLPPTDTRLRPDQRAYEHGDLTIASEEKHKLEEAQRARRREREASLEEYNPLWFDVFIENNKIIKTEYKGGYWEARETGKWPPNMPNLFDN